MHIHIGGGSTLTARSRAGAAGLLALALLAGVAAAQIRVPDGPGAVYEGQGIRAKIGQRFAIHAGKILTITRGVIDNGTILVKDGKIEAVGPSATIEVPDGYKVIDARGDWVMPGFIDLHTHVYGATAAGWGNDLNDTVNQLNPGMRSVDVVTPNNSLALTARAAGITTAVFIPGSGNNMGGWGTVVKTAGDTPEEMVLRFPGVIKVAQAGNPERRSDLGRTRMGMTWLIRDVLERGKAYHQAWCDYEAGKSSKAPARDSELDYFRSLFAGNSQALIHTQVMQVFQGTMRVFHDQVHVPGFYCSHCSMDAFKNAAEAASRGIRVDAGPRNFFLDPNTGRYLGLAALWSAGGVKNLTVNTDAPVIPEHELWLQATVASRLGLDEETAIRALTIHSAQALGLEHRLGSVEPGKDADLQIRTGSPLDVSAWVKVVLIDGVIVYDHEKEKRRF